MLKLLLTCVILVQLCPAALADDLAESRRLYALGEAASGYCPGMTTEWDRMEALGYRVDGEAEYRLYRSEYDAWMDWLRGHESREAACDAVFRDYGAGTAADLFIRP